ncbi:hypothetical protein O6H91_21G003600 [Diphasiastrum complanatum]|uniref:Uncharacterized protein n=1 Tax=Diphasiastrum complanatum TaxID=34168 RepID=A0ACC2AH83_DIPCM|nr:hypothetical protein O6H91_21G003600 [Diphasiastrum complanatum]
MLLCLLSRLLLSGNPSLNGDLREDSYYSQQAKVHRLALMPTSPPKQQICLLQVTEYPYHLHKRIMFDMIAKNLTSFNYLSSDNNEKHDFPSYMHMSNPTLLSKNSLTPLSNLSKQQQ